MECSNKACKSLFRTRNFYGISPAESLSYNRRIDQRESSTVKRPLLVLAVFMATVFMIKPVASNAAIAAVSMVATASPTPSPTLAPTPSPSPPPGLIDGDFDYGMGQGRNLHVEWIGQ
jgi:hypothetical protein